MERLHDDNPTPSGQEASPISPTSFKSSSTFVNSPLAETVPHRRSAYQRVPTSQEEDISYHGASAEGNREDNGLGIQNMQRVNQGPSIEISYSEGNTPAIPGSAGFMLSPKKSYQSLQTTPEEEVDRQFDGRSRSGSLYKPFMADSENENLWRGQRSSTLSPLGPTDGKHQEFPCTTKKHFHRPRWEFASITILVASAFSTVFSGIWLGLATGRPHYGSMITHTSQLPPSTASLLVAAFAKSIELTFVTTFVAFLGQILSQKAFRKTSQGISIAQMQMRTWILQPGSLVTHFAAVRYAAITLMGAIAVCAAVAATLYTTASDALVSPKLRFGEIQHKTLYGQVNTSFSNQTYFQDQCATPLPRSDDPEHGAQTCIAIEHSGQAYHNYAQYLTDWTKALGNRSVSANITTRPLPVGTLYDNTSVTGSWIDSRDMAADSANAKRIINNVSLAMPHAAVYAAAYHERNHILQPQDLDGLGEYYLEASVPSPAVNVLCAAMTPDELKPIVVSQWPAYEPAHNSTPFNASAYPSGYDIPNYPSWINSTAVDDVFGFGEKYGRRPPAFAKLPVAYNTILNFTGTPFQDDSLYVLATSPDSKYMMCSMRVSLSPKCSTRLHNTLSGGSMETHCEDEHNHLAYEKSQPSATSGVYNKDWRDVAAQWAIALSLNAGLNDGAASNARLLSQLIPKEPTLDPALPSIAEALAVLAGCTLLMSTLDAPLIHYWNYTDHPPLNPPRYEAFNASLKVMDYSSGGTQHWQSSFYIVLAAVFFLNLFCFGYFLTHTGLVTDFMEPQNLFALSLNSPPSRVLEGTCGGGPVGEQYRSGWHIWMNRREHFYIESTDDPTTRRVRAGGGGNGSGGDGGQGLGVEGIEMRRGGDGSRSPVGEMYDRLSLKRKSWL